MKWCLGSDSNGCPSPSQECSTYPYNIDEDHAQSHDASYEPKLPQQWCLQRVTIPLLTLTKGEFNLLNFEGKMVGVEGFEPSILVSETSVVTSYTTPQ